MEILNMQIPAEQKISRMLRQIERERRSYMDAKLRPLGLQGDMYLFLLSVNRFPGTSQDQVAEQLRLDKSNTARVALKLEKAGCIVRTPVPENRRQYAIHLTEKGKDAVSSILAVLKEWQEAVLTGFSGEEEQVLIGYLARMMASSKAL